MLAYNSKSKNAENIAIIGELEKFMIKTLFFIRLLTTMCLLLNASCLYKSGKPNIQHQNSDLDAGYLKWELLDASRQVIEKNQKNLRVGDIDVTKRDDSIDNDKANTEYFLKSISLNEDFFFSIHEFPGTQDNAKQGFSLSINSRKFPTFSWEWFNLIGESRAIKLQGNGELEIKVQRTKLGKEVTRIRFLSDVDFRVKVSSQDESQNTLRWVVTISEGSWINWPSLIDNIIVPNT